MRHQVLNQSERAGCVCARGVGGVLAQSCLLGWPGLRKLSDADEDQAWLGNHSAAEQR